MEIGPSPSGVAADELVQDLSYSSLLQGIRLQPNPLPRVDLNLVDQSPLTALDPKREKGFWIKSRSLCAFKFLVPMAGLEPARPFRVNGF